MKAAAIMRGLSAAALGLSLLALDAEPANAQRDVDIERFTPALDAEGFLGVQGTRTPGHLRTSFGAFVHYGHGVLTTEAASDAVDVVAHRAAASLSAELGLGARAALALTMPLVLYQTGDSLPGAAELPAVALSDPGLHARYRLFGDAGEQRRDGPGLALQIGATAPLGADGAFAGEGAVRGYAQLLADMHVLGAGVGASIGIRHRFDARELFGRTLRDEMTFGAALKVPIPPLHPLTALLEVRGATDFQSSETTALEGQLGALLNFGEVTLAFGAGAGFTSAIGVPDVRVLFGLFYTPKRSDSDGDGIPDDQDACPFLPEDLDGFEDDDGCPDPDNDNDLVPDIDDLCPNEAALEGRDEDEDGCTDP
jgi:OmpA-OmpF porin, OOP family